MVIKAGSEEQILARFQKEGLLEKQEGFIDLSVIEEKTRKGEKEIVVIVRWESEEHWKQWEKSDAHIAGHKANLGKPKPDYIVSQEVKRYDLKVVKK